MAESRLTAMMFTDLVGHTGLLAQNEEQGLRAAARIVDIVRAKVGEHGGSLVDVRGDGTFSTFPTALGAVSCAVAIQEALHGESILVLRIGVHLGQLAAAESEGAAAETGDAITATTAPGGIRISAPVFEAIRGRLKLGFSDLGLVSLREIEKPVHVYAIHIGAGEAKPAPAAPVGRRLAAIFLADVVSYSWHMATQEDWTVRAVTQCRGVFVEFILQHGGRVIDTSGDGVLAEFGSALDAVRCAVAVQENLRERNRELPTDRALQFRIGIDLGDVRVEGDRIYGSGVNVAARLEALAPAGGVCISAPVHEQVRYHLDGPFEDLGEQALKNIPHPIHAYAIHVDSATHATRRPPRRAAVLLAALVLLGVAGWFTWERVAPSLGATPTIRSIAVLPLENLSGDPEQEYFADGMTEALISHLAKIASLRVISRTSVMQYKGVRRSLPEIARELNVDAVIEGTVMREGEEVRITAQLIDARSDAHLWAGRFDRDLRGILALQSEIARAIAEEVRVKLTPAESARLAESPVVDPEAHVAFLKGRYYLAKFTKDDAERAMGHFEEAIRKDAEYAPAHAGLSLSYDALGGALMGFPPRHAMPKAKAAALRALELDGGLAIAHHALGRALLFFDWDWDGAAKEFQRAIALDPSLAAAHHGYADYLSALGRHPEAIEESEQAVAVAPLDLRARTQLAQAFFLARDYERGLQATREVLELEPDYARAHQWLAWLYELTERYEEAVDARARTAALANPAESSGDAHLFLAAYEKNGPEGYWRALIRQQEKQARTTRVPPMHFAWAYAQLGDADQAFAWLERAYEERGHDLVFTQVDPIFDPIRSDPRYGDLLRRIGFPES